MSKRIAMVFACLLAVAALAAILGSKAFSDAVNRRALATLQRLTGGRAEVASIQFQWWRRTLDLQRLVGHGIEPPNAPPMLSAAHVHVRLSWSALLGRTSHIDSIDVDSPDIRVQAASDVSPALTLSNLERLRIDNLHVRNGALHLTAGWNAVADRRIPFTLDAAGVEISLRRDGKRRTNLVQCTAELLRLASKPGAAVEGAFSADAEMQASRVRIARMLFRSGSSQLSAQGTLETATGLHGDLDFRAHLDAADIKWAGVATGVGDSAGRIGIGRNGMAWRVAGSAFVQNVSMRGSSYIGQPFTFRTSYLADAEGLQLSDLHGTDPLGSFAGAAQLKGWTDLIVAGNVQNVNLQRVLRHWAPSSHWAGTAAGAVRLTAAINGRKVVPTVDVDLRILPGPTGVPIEGAVAGSYSARTNTIRINHLDLASVGLQLTCSGTAAALDVHLLSANVLDLDPLLRAVAGRGLSPFESNLAGTDVQFDGTVAGGHVSGAVLLHHLTTGHMLWREVRASGDLGPTELRIAAARLNAGGVDGSLAGRITLNDWLFDPAEAKVDTSGRITVTDIRTLPLVNQIPSLAAAGMSVGFRLSGFVHDPRGAIALTLNKPEIFGQRFTSAAGKFDLSRGSLTLASAKAVSGRSQINISGNFNHPAGTMSTGILSLRLDTKAFPLAVEGSAPVLGAVSGTSAATFEIRDYAPRLLSVSGTLTSPQLRLSDAPYTDVAVSVTTETGHLKAHAAGAFAGEPLDAAIDLDPSHAYAMRASVGANQLDLQTVARLLHMDLHGTTGTLAGTALIDGPLGSPSKWHADISLSRVTLQQPLPGANIDMHSVRPAVVTIAGGSAHLSQLVLGSHEGELSADGDIAITAGHTMRVTLSGGIGLQAFELFDPNVVSSGTASINATVSGTTERPAVNGRIAIQNGSFSLKDLRTAITGVQAQVQFNRNRATITSLTGESGGGRLSMDGFVTYGEGQPLTYNVRASAHDVRYRYANAIGITGDSVLRLTGATESGVLSGNIQLSRVVVAPGMDLGAVLASTAAARQSGITQPSLLSGLQLDVQITSEANLQVSTAIARDVEAAVDVRVRGTPDHPLLFGSISANQGDLRIFGAKYSINRCEITFANTTRVEPIVDLDLETQSRGVAVDITVSGALDKLSMNYRSDPPLQPRDIIALLTVGKTPSFAPSASVQPGGNDVSALQAGANTVLGQAIAPASNGLSKLFGITNIKIDPLVQGLTNTPQSRLTVEQQISKNVTVTYVTNLAQTSEQIFRFEWSLNPQYSVVAVRDDNGEFGMDVQYKKRFH